MHKPLLTTSALVIAVALSSCGEKASSPESQLDRNLPQYEIRKDGIVQEDGKNEFSSIGDVTFFRKQEYAISYTGKSESKPNTLLAARVIVHVGSKDISDNIEIIPIESGTGKLICAHYYNIKIANYDQAADPACTIKPIGEVSLTPVSVRPKN